MGLLDMFSPIITMLMYVAYAVYIVLGLVLVIVGIASLTRQLLTSFCVGVIIVGVFMMLVGAGAIYTTMNSNWLFMLVILLVDVVLFLVLFSSAVTALFISVGGGDPVDYLFDTHWAAIRSLDGVAKEGGMCYNGMDQDLEVGGETGQWTDCAAFYNNGDEAISDDCWDGVYGYAGNCSVLAVMETAEGYALLSGYDLTSDATMWEIYSAIPDLDDTYYTTNTDIDSSDFPLYPLNVGNAFTGVGSQCADSTATVEGCQDCWLECKDNYVQITKDNMNAAAIAGVSLFFYFVVTAALNSFCLGLEDENDDGEEEFAVTGIWSILLYVCNGLVAVLGLAIIIIGCVVLFSIRDDCPLEPQASCPTTAILLLIIVGAGIMLVGGFVILGAVLKIKLLIMFSNLIFTVLCLVLLLVATGLGLAAGVLGEASTQYNDNWEEARDNIRKTGLEEVADFCLNVDDASCVLYGEDGFDANADSCEKSQDACIEEIEELVEDYASTFAIVGIAVSAFMIVIMYFSYLSIRIWRNGGDDDDEDED